MAPGRQHGTGELHAYCTKLCMNFLRQLDYSEQACMRALRYFMNNQHTNGGWGVWEAVPLDTSLALWAILKTDTDIIPQRVIVRVISFLLDHQSWAGNWNPSPWIKMDVGRAQNKISHTLSYQSATLTTAICLRALLKASRSQWVR